MDFMGSLGRWCGPFGLGTLGVTDPPRGGGRPPAGGAGIPDAVVGAVLVRCEAAPIGLGGVPSVESAQGGFIGGWSENRVHGPRPRKPIRR